MVDLWQKGCDLVIYNGVNEYLYQWCLEKRQQYFEQSKAERENTGRSLLSVKRWFFDEMSYKLLYLVDAVFESFGDYLDRVRALVPIRKSYVLEQERDPEALAVLRDAEREFLDHVDRVTESDTARAECYCRVIHGAEREGLEYAILEKWGYSAEYWYPLKGGFDERKLFLNVEYLMPHWDRLCQLLGSPGCRLYEYGESLYDDGQLLEVDVIDEYCGCECAYLPKDLSWIIYFSHEETVTFAGDILPMVKELLAGERDHWNRWD